MPFALRCLSIDELFSNLFLQAPDPRAVFEGRIGNLLNGQKP